MLIIRFRSIKIPLPHQVLQFLVILPSEATWLVGFDLHFRVFVIDLVLYILKYVNKFHRIN